MKPLVYLVGAAAIVGGLSAVALALRPDGPLPPEQPTVVKAETMPRPLLPPVVIDHPQMGPVQATKPQAAPPPVLAVTSPAEFEDREPVETVGRSIATDRAESLARIPKKARKATVHARKPARTKKAAAAGR